MTIWNYLSHSVQSIIHNPDMTFAVWVSIGSALIASATLLFSVRSKKTEILRAARNEYYDTIKGIIEINSATENLVRELGVDVRKIENTRKKSILNQHRDLLVSRADRLLTQYKIDPSDVSLTIIAETLADAGKRTEALRKYGAALVRSSSDYARAVNRRAYGRAMILSSTYVEGGENTQFIKGRSEMIEASKDLKKIENLPDYDNLSMKLQRAEVYKRLIDAQFQIKANKFMDEDFAAFEGVIKEVLDPDIKSQLNHAKLDLEQRRSI